MWVTCFAQWNNESNLCGSNALLASFDYESAELTSAPYRSCCFEVGYGLHNISLFTPCILCLHHAFSVYTMHSLFTPCIHCLHHAFSVYTMHSLFTPCILCWLSGVGMTRFRLFLSDDIMRGHSVCRIKTLRCSSYRNNDQTVWQHDLHVYSIKANRFTTWLTFTYGYVVLLM